MQTLRSVLSSLLIAALFLALDVAQADESHAHQTKHKHKDEHGHAGEEKLIELTSEKLQALGIEFEAASGGAIDSGLELFGDVRPNGDKLAHIVPRFAGIVRSVNKVAGDDVKAGEVLAVVESDESLSSYELRPQIEGTIIAKHITRGEAVDRDKGGFVVADLSTVWIELAVYPKDLEEISLGQQVIVYDGDMRHSQFGSISYLAPVVDEPTRTTRARVVLDNSQKIWRPGMFVTARVLTPQPAAIAVRRSSIHSIGGESVIFVKVPHGVEARTVVIGATGDETAEVLDGVKLGELYAVGNTFTLKAELGKEGNEHVH